MSKKKEKEPFFDDGRVIADMSADGMPGPLFWRKINKGSSKKKNASDVKLTKREYLSVILGILSSYIIFGLVVFGAFALFILFCIKVWFK